MRKKIKLEESIPKNLRSRAKKTIQAEEKNIPIAKVVINLDSDSEQDKKKKNTILSTPKEKKVEVTSPLLRCASNSTLKSIPASENSASLTSLPLADEQIIETDDRVSFLNPEVRKHYTVEIFDEWLHTVKAYESHLLSPEELHMTNAYLNLSDNARYLFVRLFTRKIKWLRTASLENYFPNLLDDNDFAPASPLEGAIQELVDSNFLNDSFSTQPDLEELLGILSLDEIRQLCNNETWAKGLKIKTKSALIQGIIRNTQTQPNIFSFPGWGSIKHTVNRHTIYTKKILDDLKRLVRIDIDCYLVFERVQMIYLRGISFEGGAMTSAIRVRIGNIRFPSYEVVRSTEVFKSRSQVEKYYQASKLSYEIFELLEDKTDLERFTKAYELSQSCHDNWMSEIEEYRNFAGSYFLLRYTAGWKYTKIMEMGIKALARQKRYSEEEAILKELLSQNVFRRGKRGDWYVRLSLVQQSHLPDRRKGALSSLETCLKGIKDSFTSPSCLNDLFTRLKRLENLKFKEGETLLSLKPSLKLPSPGRYELMPPPEVILEGERTWSTYLEAGTRLIYRGQDGEEMTVEALALDHYTRKGYKGYHCEGGLVSTLFGFLFWDLLFSPRDGVFDTPYQTAPLDLATDAFYIDRNQAIEDLLTRIENGEGESIIKHVYEREFERQPAAVGVRWDYPLDELIDLVNCIGGFGLAGILRCLAKQYGDKRAGFPDLTLWHKEKGHVRFSEVKGPNDRLSQKQRVWIDTLLRLGLRAELCTIRLVDESALLDDFSS